MKIAIVQDWLTEMGGAEKVFQAIYEIYPDSDVFTLVYNKEVLSKLAIPESKVTASFIQKLPFSRKKYRNYLPFFTYAIESFDLSNYDLIISSSYAVAKGVLTHANQLHICYCHSPVRYAWDLYFDYLKNANLLRGIKATFVKYFLHKLRLWDVSSINRVDYFISNSNYITSRIKKIYNCDATTIYPPVDVAAFTNNSYVKKEDFYFTCSRFVPYKKIALIVKSFASMPDKKLIVIGSGPEFSNVKKIATQNVTLLGYQPYDVLISHMQRAKAFVFAAEEDFGITPVEAQAAGTPVIAFGKGGTLETVKNNKTGILFYEQSEKSIIEAVAQFESQQQMFHKGVLLENAKKFDSSIFAEKIKNFINEKYFERNKQNDNE